MRLFMQDNDRISVGRVANLLETLPVSEKLKEYFEKNRSHLNHALDSPSMLVVNNDHPSKRDILQTALYGATCHVEERHRARYQSWVGAPMAQQNIDFEFDGILVVFLRALTAMAEISRRTVWELEGDAPEDYPQSPDPAQKTTYSNKRST
jgi:hypothetical protein